VGAPKTPGFCVICVICVIHAKIAADFLRLAKLVCVIDQRVCVIDQNLASFETVESALLYIAFHS
jgi:hypothetical protein